MTQFNNRIRQVVLLLVIAFLAFLIIRELYVFLPGLMGAITFYILGRERYFSLIEVRGWKPGLTALMIIVVFLILIAAPLYYTVLLVTPKISSLFLHTEELLVGVKALSDKIKSITGEEIFSPQNLASFQSNLANYIPTFLNSSAMILSNMLVMFFVAYFMFTGGRVMEDSIRKFIPLHLESVIALAHETKHMVKANAIGIPLISLIQGFFAWMGYLMFGMDDALMWGFLTGVFAFFPIVGTMMIWVPLVVFLYSQGLGGQATGLLVYSLVITGNVDYLARVTLMKRLGMYIP